MNLKSIEASRALYLYYFLSGLSGLITGPEMAQKYFIHSKQSWTTVPLHTGIHWIPTFRLVGYKLRQELPPPPPPPPPSHCPLSHKTLFGRGQLVSTSKSWKEREKNKLAHVTVILHRRYLSHCHAKVCYIGSPFDIKFSWRCLWRVKTAWNTLKMATGNESRTSCFYFSKKLSGTCGRAMAKRTSMLWGWPKEAAKDWIREE